jgi:hypothetical protein
MSISHRGRKFKKGIIYPLFFEVSERCEEEYWKQFFMDISIGKPVKGILINNGQICSHNKKKGFDYMFISKSVEDIINELLPILEKNYNTCSEKNIKTRNVIDQVRQELKEIKNSKWSKIRRKNIKKAMLLDYITEVQKKHNISLNKCMAVYDTLSFNANSQLMSKIVNMNDGKIESINGLTFTEGDMIMDIDFYKDKYKDYCEEDEELIKEEEIIQKLNIEQVWESYIKSYFKSIRNTLS